MEGKIVTFYSYKGGVGRSMALANIAVLMKRWGYNVLILDWDLEAPGLENFFKDYISLEEFQQKEGIVDLLLKYTENSPIDWHDIVQNIPFESNQKGRLDMITAGLRHEEYFANVRKFDFNSFYTEHEGGAYIETLREQWKSNYDFVLVDSRTGVTDIGGVCTVQLPDIVVLLFTATEQSLQGILRVGKKINASLKKLPVERYHISILPIPSRFENLTEFKIGQEWLERFSKDLLPLVEDWLPEEYGTPIRFKALIEFFKIPYIPYFSFGEKLPVIEQGTNDTTGIGYAYENLSLLLANDLQDTELLFTNRDILFTKVNKIRNNIYKTVQYDVFIARKSQDAHLAKNLYDFLTNKGLKVFDADHSLPEMGNVDYSRAIDEALVNTEHLIVMGSSVENITSPWVEAEWRFFLNRKRSGQAKGNLLTVVTNTLKIDELPPSLQNYEVFSMNIRNFDTIYLFVSPQLSDYLRKNQIFLSDREKELLKLISHGLTSNEIATEMNLSKYTIEEYRMMLMKKFKAKNSTHLVKLAYEHEVL
ncbi:DNA-binding NarL/FixJ family response regulator/MinD-like ATPase involved in chromosome partitioning or flagellar assembly [Runella defluvii]|uniref:DNA-binding NarL/FixJ family response regulator/MinD-like ATPase involved in chromosome partitioning or flagellar assembly n=1 Tax=Runella defluvii TaxID=370973 RepID=A0A7W6ET02_9BACT|nr:LuxR C-terminal-related transcriptional regulator [Runella defluvii]MBB3841067.1 DNA-binding NarL/FixJ family response regulator/MinD-like ATPase involved in chromosome partitioning or flagellar assembly [Runella defluvii]